MVICIHVCVCVGVAFEACVNPLAEGGGKTQEQCTEFFVLYKDCYSTHMNKQYEQFVRGGEKKKK
jgi:hypothetical protein